MEFEPLYDDDWLSENIGPSKRNWERMRQEGTGPPFVKVGKRVLYRPSDVEEWLRLNTFTSTAEAKAAKNTEAAEIARRYEEHQLVKAAAQVEKIDKVAAGRRHREREDTAS